MYNEKRSYRMTRRAEQEAQTRLRITESAVDLHGTIGPARTTISALADHAGVQRATIYRHFSDEAAILDACSAHWVTQNPLPDLEAWAKIDDPDERLVQALLDLYGYYRRTERMWANLFRDEGVVPKLTELLGGFRQYLQTAGETLMTGRPGDGQTSRLVRAALGHALAFQSWRSLAIDQGVEEGELVELMSRFVKGAVRHQAG